jgi:hypothetical protein
VPTWVKAIVAGVGLVVAEGGGAKVDARAPIQLQPTWVGATPPTAPICRSERTNREGRCASTDSTTRVGWSDAADGADLVVANGGPRRPMREYLFDYPRGLERRSLCRARAGGRTNREGRCASTYSTTHVGWSDAACVELVVADGRTAKADARGIYSTTHVGWIDAADGADLVVVNGGLRSPMREHRFDYPRGLERRRRRRRSRRSERRTAKAEVRATIPHPRGLERHR